MTPASKDSLLFLFSTTVPETLNGGRELFVIGSEEASSWQRTAQQARDSFETGRVPAFLLTVLYQAYNPMPDISSFVRIARKIFPSLNCGLASIYLQKKIGAGKVVIGNYYGIRHTFLEVDDELIIDITADQFFGGPKVYVGPLRYPWGRQLGVTLSPNLWRSMQRCMLESGVPNVSKRPIILLDHFNDAYDVLAESLARDRSEPFTASDTSGDAAKIREGGWINGSNSLPQDLAEALPIPTTPYYGLQLRLPFDDHQNTSVFILVMFGSDQLKSFSDCGYSHPGTDLRSDWAGVQGNAVKTTMLRNAIAFSSALVIDSQFQRLETNYLANAIATNSIAEFAISTLASCGTGYDDCPLSLSSGISFALAPVIIPYDKASNRDSTEELSQKRTYSSPRLHEEKSISAFFSQTSHREI